MDRPAADQGRRRIGRRAVLCPLREGSLRGLASDFSKNTTLWDIVALVLGHRNEAENKDTTYRIPDYTTKGGGIPFTANCSDGG